ncbi:MAG: polysaccharide biosynthesis protein [Candidatus Saganbacteria bacterium]|nr:polysaccharide biosynthesis protein [Candidatus Saganbacteria bacterium]
MREHFKGKKILVTGGTGSIGSEIVRQLLSYDPETIRVYSNDEDAQFNLSQEVGAKGRVRFLFGDIRERERLKWAMQGIDVVFHAAALKHVSACEFDPFEAVKTNVMGTENVIKIALEENVEKVINISTDKAANPINVLGATKLLAERITISANNYRGKKRTILSSVRFGNVLASRGSVVPIFLKQIKNGGPVTVTDPDMTRFVMTIPQAVGLILKATFLADGGEIFILKMPAVKIGLLAEAMVEMFAPALGYKASDIKIENVGVRAGEKYHEELMTHMEESNAKEMDGLFVVSSQMLDKDKGGKTPVEYDSSRARLLSKQEIKTILENLFSKENKTTLRFEEIGAK